MKESPNTKIVSPDNDSVNLNKRIEDAIKYAAKYNQDTAVFLNNEGIYLDRVYNYCRDQNGWFDIRFVALAKLCFKGKSVGGLF